MSHSKKRHGPAPDHAGGHRTAPAAGTVRPAATADRIRQRAYEKWEAAGCPPGNGVNFWLEAERELLRR